MEETDRAADALNQHPKNPGSSLENSSDSEVEEAISFGLSYSTVHNIMS